MKRRDVIRIGAALAATTLAGCNSRAQQKPLKVLILGGTGFIGPHMIEALGQHGHQITLFNNDPRSEQLFPALESLFGDRDGKIDTLKGRNWDVVIDNSGYVPRHVRLTAEALKDHVRHYVFISSISAYADLSKPGLSEDSPLATLEDPTVEQVTSETYGGLKVLCERAVQDNYGQRCTIIRPHVVVGPGDSTDRFTYWVTRASQGGDMLAPGAPNDPKQFIDVRDLAEFTRECVEKRFPGAYNTCNNPGKQTFGQVIDMSRSLSKADTRVVWVDTRFLLDQNLPPGTLPMWMPVGGPYGGATMTRNDRAVAKGLKFRSLESSVQDTLAWHAKRPDEERGKLKAGLTPEQERELLDQWKAAQHPAG